MVAFIVSHCRICIPSLVVVVPLLLVVGWFFLSRSCSAKAAEL